MKAIGAPETPTVRMLAQEFREVQTITGTAMTLTYTPLRTLDDVGLELVFVNGTAMTDPADYTIDGRVITFGSALTADVVLVRYPYRV